MTHICKRPHRVRAEMFDGGSTRYCQLQVGPNLRVNVIERRSAIR